MKLFTEAMLNSIWLVAPDEGAEDHGVDMVDVPDDDTFSAVREHVNELENSITIQGQPETYSDKNGGPTPDRYTRLRAHQGAPWGLWKR